MITAFFNFIAGAVFDLIAGITSILPQMSITKEDIYSFLQGDLVHTVLSWINYFLPLDIATSITALWATGMLAYIGIKMAFKTTSDVV